MIDIAAELPIADIRIGQQQFLRIYGFADIKPPLVEWRLHRRGGDEVLRLTIDQARRISAALTAAANRASGN